MPDFVKNSYERDLTREKIWDALVCQKLRTCRYPGCPAHADTHYVFGTPEYRSELI